MKTKQNNKYLQPMLAHKYDENRVDWSKPVWMQPKLDGIRCILTKDGAFSRTGKQFMNVKHLFTPAIKELFNQNPWIHLDGELYNHDLRDDFEKIVSLARKQKPTPEDRSEAESLVQFHCYDIVNPTMKFEDRIQFITNNVPRNHCVHHVDTIVAATESLSKVFHESNLQKGYEGSILRLNDFYQNKRSHSLRKFKDFHDTEATIVGYEEGKGKREGTLGKFLMQDDDGIQFGCPPGKGYSYKDLTKILDNIHEYMGQRATFTYFERTKANSYRHPLFKTLRNYE